MTDKTKIDPQLQQQVDTQLMEQGSFSPIELLFDSGRLGAQDYESWRRGEVGSLDELLMGNPEKIRAQLQQAASYARSIGLTEQPQEFYAWQASGPSQGERLLTISADRELQRLIGSRYAPAQSAPQLDLFFDNPVVALTNGIVRALSARNASQAQRQLDRLYAQAPNHADLGAFDLLLAALGHLGRADLDSRQELDFLLQVNPAARRLLGSQARDLLGPLWRQLAQALHGHTYSAAQPELHASFAFLQAQDWAGVSETVLGEPRWWRHAPLCQRLAQSAFHRQRRLEALTAWFQLCWHDPQGAACALEGQRHIDASLTRAWQLFADSEEESSGTATLSAVDFPAWMLLHEPALAQQLPQDLPEGATPGEANYRHVHGWIHARLAGREDEEMALRRTLQSGQPTLFRYLKERSAVAIRAPAHAP